MIYLICPSDVRLKCEPKPKSKGQAPSTSCCTNIPTIVLRLIWHFFSLADLSHRRRPSRAVSSQGRATASAAAAGAALAARAAPHALARGLDVGNLRRASPQPMDLSSPLSVWTECLGSGMIFYRNFLGSVVSDLRSPGIVDSSVGAVFVRARARGHEIQIYDKSSPLPAQTRRPCCVAIKYETSGTSQHI